MLNRHTPKVTSNANGIAGGGPKPSIELGIGGGPPIGLLLSVLFFCALTGVLVLALTVAARISKKSSGSSFFMVKVITAQ